MNRVGKFAAIALIQIGFAAALPVWAQTVPASNANPLPAAGAPLADLERRAAQGDAEAAEQAGRALHAGRAPDGAVVVRDDLRARAYLRQAAGAGRGTARTLLDTIDASPAPVPATTADPVYVPGPHGC
jgi:TPR repeat protein